MNQIQNETHLPAKTLIERLCDEVDGCADLVSHIEASVFTEISSGEQHLAKASLQNIDLLLQSLQDISRALKGVAQASENQSTLDILPILAPLHQNGIRNRLAGGKDACTHSHHIELFAQ